MIASSGLISRQWNKGNFSNSLLSCQVYKYQWASSVQLTIILFICLPFFHKGAKAAVERVGGWWIQQTENWQLCANTLVSVSIGDKSTKTHQLNTATCLSLSDSELKNQLKMPELSFNSTMPALEEIMEGWMVEQNTLRTNSNKKKRSDWNLVIKIIPQIYIFKKLVFRKILKKKFPIKIDNFHYYRKFVSFVEEAKNDFFSVIFFHFYTKLYIKMKFTWGKLNFILPTKLKKNFTK